MMTETIPRMLWSATPDGAVDYCSQHVFDYTGMRIEELVGSGRMKAVHPEDAPAMANANACSRLLANESPDVAEVREAVSDIAEAGTRASAVISRIRALLKSDA